jgi:hypothetical protein
MNTEKAKNIFREVIELVGFYLVWLTLSGVAIWLVLRYRISWLSFIIRFNVDPFVVTAMDRFGIIFVGVATIGLIAFIEAYLRKGFERGIFLKKFGRVTLVLIAVFYLSLGLELIL